MEYFAHQVTKGWYRLYYGWMLVTATAIIGVYITGQFEPNLLPQINKYGVTLTAAILAGILAFYCLTMYWLVARKNLPFAIFMGAMLFLLLILNGVQQTELTTYSLPYIIGWGTLAGLGGLFGLPFSVGSAFLTYLYVLMQSEFDITAIPTLGWFLLALNTVLAVLGYLFWRNRFVDQTQQAVSQLSGMLRSNQQQSEILIQSIADGVIVINTEGKINLINPTAAKLTEWKVAEAIGVDVQMVVKLSQENGQEIKNDENPFSAVLARKERLMQTLQLTGRNDKKSVISLVISPVLAQGGSMAGAVAVIRDISEEHAAEKQRGEFISTASHEMRTPVAAIEGYLALALNEKVSNIDGRARGYLEKAHASTQHLGKLFQDLLTSAKAEDGRLSNHPVVVEMGQFMEQLVEDVRFSAQKKGLLTEFVVGASDQAIDATGGEAASLKVVKPLYYVHADPERLREVITNLIDNAIKYTDQGKISVGLTGNTEVVQVYIRDTGPGIPADDIPHLFQKFYRVDNSATRVIGGTGLGLFICRKIIELYSGRIWVESELGKGSTFFINLPRLGTQRALALQASEANAVTSVPPSAANTSSK